MAQPPPLPLQTAQKEPDMTKKSADLLVGELADHFARVLDAVLPSGKLDLVDFPNPSNVGDSPMLLGAVVYLRKNNHLPAYHSALADFDDDASRAAQTGRAHIYTP